MKKIKVYQFYILRVSCLLFAILALVLPSVSTVSAQDSEEWPCSTKARRQPTTTYRITVATGSIEDAGTDANVYITLCGTKGASGERTLDNYGDDREQGQTDVYGLRMQDVGEILAIRIRHDNSGNKPGWFLDQIVVHNERTDEEWVFPNSRWLAVDEDDNKTDRTLDSR